MDKLIPLDLPAGMRNTGTVYQSKDRWYTGNLVRFFQDTIQPIGGWAARTLTGATIVGVPRAMITYRINSGAQILVIGTVSNIYAISGTVVYDITPAGLGVSATRIWQLDVFGTWLIACDLNAPKTAGACYYWTGDTATDLVQLGPFDGTDPTRALSIVGTPERFMVTLGSLYTASGYVALGKNANSRRVTWATQEAGFDTVDWTPTASNTAGDFELTTNGSLMCGKRGRGLTLLWTTTDLWTMTYIGGDFIFRFDQAANECGIISSHAAVVTNVGAFWMGENGFFTYEGFVSPIPCDVQDYVFGSLNRTYAHYIWALENPAFNEVTWFYPHAAQTEITRYVTYNYVEKHWTTGTLARTAGVSQQPGTHTFPVMTNASGSVFDHETGVLRNSEGTPSLESGPLEIADGDRLLSIQKIIPDDRTVGDVNLTIYTAPNPDTAETANGPYDLIPQTSVRLKARQIRVKLTEESPVVDSLVTNGVDESGVTQGTMTLTGPDFDANEPLTLTASQAQFTANGVGAWASVTINSTDGWTAPAWSSTLSRFVAVQLTGGGGTPGTDDIAYSANGIAWTLVSTGLLTRTWMAVEWVPFLSKYVALAGSYGGAITDAVATSPDGITWTPQTAADGYWNLAASGAKVVALAASDDTVMTSTNGTVWTVEATTGGPVSWDKIAYSSTLGLFVATGFDVSNDIAIYSSANGTAWTLRYSHAAGTQAGIVWDATLAKFVVVVNDGKYVTSTNGTSWTAGSFTGAAAAFPAVDVATAGGFLVATSGTTNDVITSPDGTTWTFQSNVLPGADSGGTIRWGAGVSRFVTGRSSGIGGADTYYATYSAGSVGDVFRLYEPVNDIPHDYTITAATSTTVCTVTSTGDTPVTMQTTALGDWASLTDAAAWRVGKIRLGVLPSSRR